MATSRQRRTSRVNSGVDSREQSRNLRRDAMQMAVDWYTALGVSSDETRVIRFAERISTFIFRGAEEEQADGPYHPES